MNQLKILPVKTAQDKKRFVKSQWNFYKDDPYFVPPVIIDRMKLLNTKKNPFYKHSEIELFLAERDGEIVGRIAGIVNDNHNKTHNDKIGFFGFFECEDNQNTANELFKAVETWLKSKGMTDMRGPVNPSMNDECGLLVDGFDSTPLILMTYNPKYYMSLYDNFGLTKAKDLYAYYLVNKNYMTEKLTRMQALVRKRYQMTIREVNLKDKVQFKKDIDVIKSIYNSAWQPNWGFVKMTDEEFDFLASDMKTIADKSLVFIVEIKGKPAGFNMTLLNINESLIHNKNGGILGAAWHLLTKKKQINWVRTVVLGVLPEFQKTGIDAVMYWESGMSARKLGAAFAEGSWILEDNEMMKKGLTQTMNGEHYKTYRLYEKSIN